MTFWLAAALLVGAILIPLVRSLMTEPVVAASVETDVAFFRAQEQEIERQAASGAITDAEAKAALAEAARKLLAKAKATAPDAVATSSRYRKIIGLLVLVIPVATGALYYRLGAPGMPDTPFANRTDISRAEQDFSRMVARLDAHLSENPEDVRGHELAFPVYMRLGRYDNAALSAQKIIALKGESAERVASLAEALIFVAKGEIAGEARSALERALELDPKLARARFYSGLLAEQEGNPDKAVAILKALEGDVGDGAEKQAVAAQIARLSKTKPHTSTADTLMALPEAERKQAISGMVENLATRLKEQGGTPDEWERLVRALAVLGDKDRARAAVRDAKAGIPDEAQTRIDKLAKELGLDEGGVQ
jgi:cytochrome c-type biogenesis protein CcmH